MQELKNLSLNFERVLEKIPSFSKAVADNIVSNGNKHILLAARNGLGLTAAMEGALKIKELTYLHC